MQAVDDRQRGFIALEAVIDRHRRHDDSDPQQQGEREHWGGPAFRPSKDRQGDGKNELTDSRDDKGGRRFAFFELLLRRSQRGHPLRAQDGVIDGAEDVSGDARRQHAQPVDGTYHFPKSPTNLSLRDGRAVWRAVILDAGPMISQTGSSRYFHD